MDKFETGFIAEFKKLDDTIDDYGNLAECIFLADDAEIKITLDTEEHSEVKRLEPGKFYHLTIESRDE